MPGLLQQRIAQFPHATAGSLSSNNAIWSRRRDDTTSDQLQKFWSELPIQARQELLKIDKQSLFEQARKNLYCSRCNGLLLEGFTQIVMYGKSLQQEGGAGVYGSNRTVHSKVKSSSESEDAHDPSVHPWGGLTTTRDGILTLLDCFINAKSLKALQNVFNNARARERERELLYPDACGGGGRGWISHGMASYGRGHGTRETCALHTARLSCDTLVDFWSALSDETRSSLLRMKEEDFIERLMYRFDSKRFCRDCRRNVIREFKELKELKRMRREPRCSSWFCVADTAFQYEVSEDTVEADWHQSFTESVGTYHHFEWAIGTGEGKSDILDFEDVGMNGKVHMNGLDLGGLSACFITLKAWKLDGRCTELCVKAHALKGQPCVHRRLIVGDGFVTMTKGESIKRFFEHAEEVEEEEDDDAMDKDGNEYDGDGSRPQKHAKSPELAREFLLDAATVIFKEQVEKAFREGTARQNAHSIFVCLSLKLLEDRIHVACKEIITLEKQIKLLEEEEREKQEEEERKERRRAKEREKKFRRKERLKGKDRERERKLTESNLLHFASPASNNELSTSTHDDSPNTPDSGDSISEAGDIAGLFNPISPDSTNEQSFDGCADSNDLKSGSLWHQCHVDEELRSMDENGSFILEQSKSSRKKLRFKKDSLLDQASNWYDDHCSVQSDESSVHHDESDRMINGYTMASSRCIKGVLRSTRDKVAKTNTRTGNLKFSEKFHCSNSRMRDGYDFQSCSCNKQGDRRIKAGYHNPTIRSARVIKSTNKVESSQDMPRPLFHSGKCNHACYVSDSSVIPRGKLVSGTQGRDNVHTKQVWEPTNVRKKCARSNFDSDVTLRTAIKQEPSQEVGFDKDEHQCEPNHNTLDVTSAVEFSRNSCEANTSSSQQELEGSRKGLNKSDPDTLDDSHNGFVSMTKSDNYSKNDAEEAESCPMTSGSPTLSGCDHAMSTSSSDNCSSCLSEVDSSTSSSIAQNAESSSTSDSEDASQQSDGRYVSTCNINTFHTFSGDSKSEDVPFTRATAEFLVPREEPTSSVSSSCNGSFGLDISPSQQCVLPIHDQSMHVPVFPSATMGYHNPSGSSWSITSPNGLMPFPQHNHYVVPNAFGFNLPANQFPDFQMQYNTVQPLAIPLLSLQQHSLYQTANGAYGTSTQDKIKNSNVSGSQQTIGAPDLTGRVHPLELPCPNRQLSSKPPSGGQNNSVGSAAKRNGNIPSFSLFHFGGPVTGAAGYNVNPVSLKEANIGGFESNLPAAHTNLTCSKEDTTIEEYSLFSASIGSRFSFF